MVGAGDLAQQRGVDPAVELVVLRDLTGDGNEEEEEGPRLLVIHGAGVHGPVAFQLGLGYHLLSMPLNARGEEEGGALTAWT